ncbi:response regulator [Thiothrix nivea]|uniref:Two component transcriptional regulator, LuxR family n=1 Tax=Thiothrix nivea (strain ATCC 35100 / DSM 5205 / JP2) TaxID=870187 RepID=A0A656HDG8_THINJ|nr:response regulator transcription factor [Thiothrix nivea]EIJ34024.1 two component transcriptional regulator, LuxR family [Thiothrix nivea DSM 5205]
MFNVMVVEDVESTCNWMQVLLGKAFPDVKVVFGHTLAEARGQLGQQFLALALVDLNLPDGSGLELIPHIRRHSPETRIIVMTIFDDHEHIFNAIRAGAIGYLLKDQSEKILINKLRGVMEGDPPLSPLIARKILEQVRDSDPIQENHAVNPPLHIDLNQREEEILVLISKGMNRTEIAEILSLSPHTVARYIKDVYQKLDVSSRAEAAIMACRIGLVRMS